MKLRVCLQEMKHTGSKTQMAKLLYTIQQGASLNHNFPNINT